MVSSIQNDTTTATNGTSIIPVIDLQCISNNNSDNNKYNNNKEFLDEENIGFELVKAFRTVGFATLIHHGIDTKLIQNAFHASQLFFTTLSLEQKMKSKYVSHQSNRGYIAMGQETHNKQTQLADRKETFDIGKEYGDEDGYVTPWPDPNDVPDDQFKTILLEYFHQMNQLNLYIMKLIGIGLKLNDPNFFVDRCNKQHCNLRLLHYPELNRNSIVNSNNNNDVDSTLMVQRGVEHRDYGTITLLTQDMTGGLRVQLLDGTYVFVDPVPDSIIINVGEMLQRWTNDYLKANPHHVVDPPKKKQSNSNNNGSNSSTDDANIIPERYSIAFFCNANKDVLLVPMNVGDDNDNNDNNKELKYEPITAIEHLTQRLGATITAST